MSEATMVYPPLCKPISTEMTADELHKRLQMLARGLKSLNEESTLKYRPLALHLSTEYFVEHSSNDVRLLVACCISDLFRIYSPDGPYTDTELLHNIFTFFVKQLDGIQHTESSNFKRCFYLLENLCYFKMFNMCMVLDRNQIIFMKLFRGFFKNISASHSSRVMQFMLDIMTTCIQEADMLSSKIIDIILECIIEPAKSQHTKAYEMAKKLIVGSSDFLKPPIQSFLNTVIMTGEDKESTLSNRIHDMIGEIHGICPSILLAVMPQLEYRLRSQTIQERHGATKLLGHLFSRPDSMLSKEHAALWQTYLGRFTDAETQIRKLCIQQSLQFLKNQPELVPAITECLEQREHDSEEPVRVELIHLIAIIIQNHMTLLSQPLLNSLQGRLLDKKFSIRKDALIAMGHVYYASHYKADEMTHLDTSWVADKILHSYYLKMDDQVLATRLFITRMIPFKLNCEERARKLLMLYGSVDENSVRVIKVLLQTRVLILVAMRNFVELCSSNDFANKKNEIMECILKISKIKPESPKLIDNLKKIALIVQKEKKLQILFMKLFDEECTCINARPITQDILKFMGDKTFLLYKHIQALLGRVAPMILDRLTISKLVTLCVRTVNGQDCLDIRDGPIVCLQLLQSLSKDNTHWFQDHDIYEQIIELIKNDEEIISHNALQILNNIGKKVITKFPDIYSILLPTLQKLVKFGSPKQAKHAIRCMQHMSVDETVFKQLFQTIASSLDLDSPYILTHVVAIGHLVEMYPTQFYDDTQKIVAEIIVKELIMTNRYTITNSSTEKWYEISFVSQETRAKMQGMKMIARWLKGHNKCDAMITNTLQLFTTILERDGDLLNSGDICEAEMAHIRIGASCSLLKLLEIPIYSKEFTDEQFQTLSLLLNDPCIEVRKKFAARLNKGLLSLRLPVKYMSILCLAHNDPVKSNRLIVKNMISRNIQQRIAYMKKNVTSKSSMYYLLPDYTMPHVIHLLAHDPDFSKLDDIKTLNNIKGCITFILECLMKTENYSYSFYKNLVTMIKMCRDNQCFDDNLAHERMYAVCDIVSCLILKKDAVIRDTLAEPSLPSMFVKSRKSPNNKIYLPSSFISQFPHMKKMIKDFNMATINPSGASREPLKNNRTASTSSSMPPLTISSTTTMNTSLTDDTTDEHGQSSDLISTPTISTSSSTPTTTTTSSRHVGDRYSNSSSAANYDTPTTTNTATDDAEVHEAVNDILSATLNTSCHARRSFATIPLSSAAASSSSPPTPPHGRTTTPATTPKRSSLSVKHRSLAEIAASIGKRKSSTQSPSTSLLISNDNNSTTFDSGSYLSSSKSSEKIGRSKTKRHISPTKSIDSLSSNQRKMTDFTVDNKKTNKSSDNSKLKRKADSSNDSTHSPQKKSVKRQKLKENEKPDKSKSHKKDSICKTPENKKSTKKQVSENLLKSAKSKASKSSKESSIPSKLKKMKTSSKTSPLKTLSKSMSSKSSAIEKKKLISKSKSSKESKKISPKKSHSTKKSK